MSKKVIIGSRGSKLALVQAELVMLQLKQVESDLDIEIKKIVTEGDRNQVANIEDVGEVGIFVKALEDALIKCEIDMAVHSLKDLPIVLPEQLSLIATTERCDPCDVLVATAPLMQLRPGARIGTSSVRRSAQLKHLRPDLETVRIRGNVDTRLRKVASGEIDGLLVAAAAMVRLGREKEITEYLPEDYFVPAAGQGALGIEIRRDDKITASIAATVNHLSTWIAITAERAFLAYLGGGCSAPISCIAVTSEGLLKITGMISDREGNNVIKGSLERDADNPVITGELLAKKMLREGAKEIVDKIRCR
ncbi:MAG: hydroxymethylbilane synthase [Dehalococcoidia bacterium]|nr:MAG: hydroxymethylbilane synthase [Dehalococcoidia bacterium]